VRVVVEEGPLDQAREVALLREVLEVGADHLVDPLARGAGLVEGRQQARAQARHRGVDDLAVQALLRAEVVADQRRVHARGAGDVSHRGRGVADDAEGGATGGQQGLRGPVAALFAAVDGAGLESSSSPEYQALFAHPYNGVQLNFVRAYKLGRNSRPGDVRSWSRASSAGGGIRSWSRVIESLSCRAP
jgi:hypothetical protein